MAGGASAALALAAGPCGVHTRMLGVGCAGRGRRPGCRVRRVGAWRRRWQGPCVMARGACALRRCWDARTFLVRVVCGRMQTWPPLRGVGAHAAAACLSGGRESWPHS
jgi:hypothetical protein